MQKKAPMILLKGQAGVWRVASMLALRGMNPLFPGVDHGYDLMIGKGVRIQVKSTHKRFDHLVYQKTGAYHFHLRRSAYARGNNTLVKNAPRIFSESSDFVVLWGIDEDRFWVVPSSEVDGVSLVLVGPTEKQKPDRPDINLPAILELRESGMSLAAIARYFDCSRGSISRRLSGDIGLPLSGTPKYTISSRVRACEDRWDLIQSYMEMADPNEDSLPANSAGQPEMATVVAGG